MPLICILHLDLHALAVMIIHSLDSLCLWNDVFPLLWTSILAEFSMQVRLHLKK